MYKLKCDSEGKIQRHKARLVAKGFLQTPGVDFSETFSLVIKASTLKIILILAVCRDWGIKQIDVNNAFLNGKLEDEVYMDKPRGFVDKKNPDFGCKLEKALYGLRQAPKAWHEKLRRTLLQWKFRRSKADDSLFFLMDERSVLFTLIYVDDIIVIGNNGKQIQSYID